MTHFDTVRKKEIKKGSVDLQQVTFDNSPKNKVPSTTQNIKPNCL